MNIMTNNSIREQLQRHIQRLERRIEKRATLSKKYSTTRLIYFGVSVTILYLVSSFISDVWFMGIFVGLIAGFIVLMDRHRKVAVSKEKLEHLLAIKKEHIARMNLNWAQIPIKNFASPGKNHPFSGDLDLLGTHSLFQLIDTAIFKESAQHLKQWLLNPVPNTKEVERRQQQVQALTPLQGFRDKLRVIGLMTKRSASLKNWGNEQMLQWLRAPARKGYLVPLTILSVLATLNIIFLSLMLAGWLSPFFLMGSFVSYLLYYKFNDQFISGLFDATYNIERILDRFNAILLHLENFHPAKNSCLDELLSRYQSQEERPSQLIRKTQRLMSRAALQVNQVLWMIVNVVVPWDFYHAWRVEQLKEELEPKLTHWLEGFYEIEALNSLANYAMLHPNYCWPEITKDKLLVFEATQLGHPLIHDEQRVSNDFSIQKGKDLFLITGSNMSGKSTFLRTVGVNLVLAFAGAPVAAEAMKTDLFRVFSSINITDSLDEGYSHFYTEVRRLRFLLDELEKIHLPPLFFLVDEIYRGTNNRERFAGSAAFLKEVAGKHGVGLVSSHDLELAELEKEIPQLSNLHFVESIKNQKMSFEYLLRYGPCPSTNALEIMKMEGLPV